MTVNGFGTALSNPSDLLGQFDADALLLVKMIFRLETATPLDSSGLFGPLGVFRLAGLGGSFPNHSCQ